MTKEQLVKINKDYFISSGKIILEAYLISVFPFLANPIWKKVLDTVVTKILTALANGFELIGFFVYTDLRVTSQGKAYVQAKLKGYEVEMRGTDEEKRKAEEEIKRTFTALAKFTS